MLEVGLTEPVRVVQKCSKVELADVPVAAAGRALVEHVGVCQSWKIEMAVGRQVSRESLPDEVLELLEHERNHVKEWLAGSQWSVELELAPSQFPVTQTARPPRAQQRQRSLRSEVISVGGRECGRRPARSP